MGIDHLKQRLDNTQNNFEKQAATEECKRAGRHA